MRLKTNPELEKLLLKKPDVFVYGEAETSSPLNLSIDGYVCYLHKSKLEVGDNYRRGLAIFYLAKYRFLFTTVYSSKEYDIVWMRLKTDFNPVFFCFSMPQDLTTPYTWEQIITRFFLQLFQNLLRKAECI